MVGGAGPHLMSSTLTGGFICISAACVGRICAAATTARPEATANGTIGRFISFPPWFTGRNRRRHRGGHVPPHLYRADQLSDALQARCHCTHPGKKSKAAASTLGWRVEVARPAKRNLTG